MSGKQLYASVDEIIEATGLNGAKSLMGFIQKASDYIQREAGYDFLPVIETRTFPGSGEARLIVMDCLRVSAILTIDSDGDTDETLESDDWELTPFNGLWTDGPHTTIRRKDGGTFSSSLRVQVTGVWGLYDVTEELGETVSQDASQTTLTVDDGSNVSVGMVVQVEDEYEFVSGWGSPTTATSELANGVQSTENVLSVDDGSEFNEGEVILLGTEKLRINLINGNDLAVVRGWDETSQQEHNTGDTIKVYRTFTVERGIHGSSAAAHTSKALSRVKAPESVNYLAIEMASLMAQKAKTGFAGQAGSGYGGGNFFLNEFPHQVEDVLKHFPMISF